MFCRYRGEGGLDILNKNLKELERIMKNTTYPDFERKKNYGSGSSDEIHICQVPYLLPCPVDKILKIPVVAPVEQCGWYYTVHYSR